MKWLIVSTLFIANVFAQDLNKGKQVVFDHNGKRQMATIGTNPKIKGEALWASVGWYEDGNMGKNNYNERLDLKAAGVVLEIPSLSVQLQNKSVEIKAGQTIIGKDNKVYEVVGVFSNGEIGLRPLVSEYGKMKAKITTVVQTMNFIDTVGQTCVQNICVGAYVTSTNFGKLCRKPPMGYYKKNNLVENISETEDCSRFKEKTSRSVSHVFMDGSVIAQGEIARGVIHSSPVEDTPKGVAQ